MKSYHNFHGEYIVSINFVIFSSKVFVVLFRNIFQCQYRNSRSAPHLSRHGKLQNSKSKKLFTWIDQLIPIGKGNRRRLTKSRDGTTNMVNHSTKTSLFDTRLLQVEIYKNMKIIKPV